MEPLKDPSSIIQRIVPERSGRVRRRASSASSRLAAQTEEMVRQIQQPARDQRELELSQLTSSSTPPLSLESLSRTESSTPREVWQTSGSGSSSGSDDTTLSRAYRPRDVLHEIESKNKQLLEEIFAMQTLQDWNPFAVASEAIISTEELFGLIYGCYKSNIEQDKKDKLVLFCKYWQRSNQGRELDQEVFNLIRAITRVSEEAPQAPATLTVPSLNLSVVAKQDFVSSLLEQPLKGKNLEQRVNQAAEDLLCQQVHFYTELSKQDLVLHGLGRETVITDYIKFLNLLSGYAVHAITSQEDAGNQEKVMDFFIRVARRCEELNDHASSFSLNILFSHADLKTLTAVYQKKHCKATRKRFTELFVPNNNFSVLQRRVKNGKGVRYIPFIGIYNGEIMHLLESNESQKRDPIDKLKALTQVVEEFCAFQKQWKNTGDAPTEFSTSLVASIKAYTMKEEQAPGFRGRSSSTLIQ